MAGAGAGAEVGARAEKMDKSGAEKEPQPKINNFGSTTLKKSLARKKKLRHFFVHFLNFSLKYGNDFIFIKCGEKTYTYLHNYRNFPISQFALFLTVC